MEMKNLWIYLIIGAILFMLATVLVIFKNPKMHQTLIIQKIIIERVKK